MFCEQCGTQLAEGTQFCMNCGTRCTPDGIREDDKTVILHEDGSREEEPEVNREEGQEVKQEVIYEDKPKEKRFCPNCGASNGLNDLFCQQCGMFFGNTEEQIGCAAAPGKTRAMGSVRKALPILMAAAAVVIIGAVLAPRILGGMGAKGKKQNFVMYVKENEFTMARGNKYELALIGDEIYEEPDEYIDYLSNYNAMVQYSQDYQFVYYLQKINDDGGTLYRMKLGSKKAEPEKIDSKVIEYQVIDDDRLIYVKDDNDRKLYLYQKGESEKIDSNVKPWNLSVSADKKYFMWQDDDNRLYVQDIALKADKVKLDSDVNRIYGVSDNFDTIVYQKEDKLYVMKGMEEKEKLASDVSGAYLYDINGSLKMYYLKDGDQTAFRYYDLIEDDCLVQDQQTAEPRIEDYQRVTYQDSFWGLQERVEIDDSYYDELDKYLQKRQRDYLRESLKNEGAELEECDIYYYEEASGESGKVMTVLQKQGEEVYGSAARESALMYVYNIDMEESNMPKLSDLHLDYTPALEDLRNYSNIENFFDIANVDDVKQAIMEQACAAEESRQLVYIENGELHEIEGYEGTYIGAKAREDEKILYLYDMFGEDRRLYRFNYEKKDASPELITDEFAGIVSWDMDEICYINEDQEVYYGETRIAEEVGGYKACENGVILYLTDMDQDGKEGTLHLYQNGKDTEIADDVSPAGGYGIFDGDKVAFLTDYNFKRYEGDLNVYDGKKVTQIDSDVTYIIF